MLGEAGEGKAFHQSAQRVAQLPVDAALGGRGELLRHQQDALLPASARARMRWYSRVVFPLPEPPKSSFNMVNLSVGSVFYRGRPALIFLSLYHKIAATSILWYNEEKSSQKEDTCMKILAVDYGDSRTGLATCDRTEFLTSPSRPRSPSRLGTKSPPGSARWQRRSKPSSSSSACR